MAAAYRTHDAPYYRAVDDDDGGGSDFRALARAYKNRSRWSDKLLDKRAACKVDAPRTQSSTRLGGGGMKSELCILRRRHRI